MNAKRSRNLCIHERRTVDQLRSRCQRAHKWNDSKKQKCFSSFILFFFSLSRLYLTRFVFRSVSIDSVEASAQCATKLFLCYYLNLQFALRAHCLSQTWLRFCNVVCPRAAVDSRLICAHRIVNSNCCETLSRCEFEWVSLNERTSSVSMCASIETIANILCRLSSNIHSMAQCPVYTVHCAPYCVHVFRVYNGQYAMEKKWIMNSDSAHLRHSIFVFGWDWGNLFATTTTTTETATTNNVSIFFLFDYNFICFCSSSLFFFVSSIRPFIVVIVSSFFLR